MLSLSNRLSAGLDMRVFFAVGVLVIVAGVTACTSVATRVDARQSAAQPTMVTVTCTDTTSDAASLQQAINSSSSGAVIEIRGGICLLTRGIIFLGNRTYAGYNTTG